MVSVAMCLSLSAQDKALMANYQSELQQLFEEVYTAPTDNQRYLASESAVKLFTEALSVENSIRWQWDFGSKVSVLTAPDKKFRIITWPVVNDVGEYECFGLVQALNERTKEYDVYELHDRSELIVNRQEEGGEGLADTYIEKYALKVGKTETEEDKEGNEEEVSPDE